MVPRCITEASKSVQTDRHTDTQTHRRTDRQTDGQTDRRKDMKGIITPGSIVTCGLHEILKVNLHAVQSVFALVLLVIVIVLLFG